MVPSESEAVALNVTCAGAYLLEPLAGEVNETVGGWLTAAITATETVAEVVVPPELSVARAVKL